MAHTWEETRVYCEDCGDHPGLQCLDDNCYVILDLIFNDDPRLVEEVGEG